MNTLLSHHLHKGIVKATKLISLRVTYTVATACTGVKSVGLYRLLLQTSISMDSSSFITSIRDCSSTMLMLANSSVTKGHYWEKHLQLPFIVVASSVIFRPLSLMHGVIAAILIVGLKLSHLNLVNKLA